MRGLIVLALLVPLLMAGGLYGLFVLWGDELPTPHAPREVAPSLNTLVYDRHGNLVAELFAEENRTPVQLQEVPAFVLNALLSTEDRRFYKHWGVDLWAIFRAMRSNVASGGISQGGSTLTQQLARNLFLSNSQTFERKLKETVLAVRIERSFSKDEILELYLNQVYFGEGAYGIKAAADRYFGKSIADLTIDEAALLIGVVANPSAYSPFRHPVAARSRRNVVLRRMEQGGVIDHATRQAAESTEVHVGARARARWKAPYFTEMVRRELMTRYGGDAVYRGGLKVYTTLDLGLQAAAERAVEDQVQALEAEHALAYRHMHSAATRMGTLEDRSSTPYLQAALVAVEPQTGAIRSMVGGRDFAESNFNRATQARRQPGSAFKPFIYAAALARGQKTNDMVLDAPVSFSWAGPGGRRQVWSPQNFSRKYAGSVTLRFALMKSLNTASVRMLEKVGPKPVIELAHRMGVDEPLPAQMSLALGTGELTPLELTSAYATFANQGIWRDPFAIERVEDRYGRVLETHQPRSREGLDERASYETLSLMRSVLDGGTAWKARSEYQFTAPAAGKTGTTDDYSDAWFVGCVPRLACGVWVGFDEKKSIGSRMTGAAAALPAWCAFMRAVVETYGEEDFTPPPGIVEVWTCVTSGQLAASGCRRAAKDAYNEGTEPHAYCSVHGGGPAPEPAGADEPVDEDE